MSSARIDRSSSAAGWTLVAVTVVAVALVAVATTLGTTIYRMPVALSFGIALVHAIAIPLALFRPLAAGLISAAAVTTLAIVQVGVEGAPWPWAITTLITHSFVVGLVGLQARSRIGVGSWALAVAGTMVVALVYPQGTDAPAINIIIASGVTGLVLGAGIIVREWRSIRAQLIRERAVSADEHERRVLAEEKTRIARELHDVVAHSMSIINVQASSAVYRHSDVPAPVAREFDDIAQAARTAMVELRSVLGVLRQEGSAPDLAPQPGLRDVPALVEATAISGVDVTLEFDDALATEPVSDASGLAAYRVVQEALSNAMRHAPGAMIHVTCSREADAVIVSVLNFAPAALAAADAPGHGLIGMRERVHALHGTVKAGPTGDGGFLVTARIPTGAIS